MANGGQQGQTDYPNLNPFASNSNIDTQQVKADANGSYQNVKNTVYDSEVRDSCASSTGGIGGKGSSF